ncbi:MAG: hypothetical protein ACO1SX_11860 [Actinomycetota bacterium]
MWRTTRERKALWSGAPFRFAFPPERGRVVIPRETAHELGQGSLETLGGGFDEETERDVPAPMTALERLRGELALQRRRGRVQLRLRLRVLGSYLAEAGERRVERIFREDVERDLPLTQPTGPALDASVQTLREPISVRAEPLAPGQTPRTVFADLVEQLAAQLPYPLLADGYLSILHRQLTAERQPLAQFLRDPCETFNRLCRYERGYLTFRTRDWAVYRGLELPARRVRRWETEVEAQGALRLHTLAEIAEHCTAEHVDQLPSRWSRRTPEGIHLRLKQELAQSEALLRLLYSLPAGAWRSLEAGRALPARSLAPASQSRLRQVLQDAADRGYEATGEVSFANLTGPPGGGFDAEDRQDAAFGQATVSLQRRPASWFITSFGFHPVEQLEQALKLERQQQPRATERDLQRVDGERVQVLVTLPGAQPVRHAFLVATATAPERGDDLRSCTTPR